MDLLNIILSSLALITTTISLVISLRQILVKRKAEEKFIHIIKEYLKKKNRSNNTVELIINFDQHLKINLGQNKSNAQLQEDFLKQHLEINTLQKEFVNLTANLDEKDKNLINEGLIQPSTRGRFSYMAKLLEKAK